MRSQSRGSEISHQIGADISHHMFRRREPPRGEAAGKPEEDLELKVKRLRQMNAEIRDAIDPDARRPPSARSPGFIALYLVLMMIVISGVVFRLKGYF
jgi:hypothetical protein